MVVSSTKAANADLTFTHHDDLENLLGAGTTQVGSGRKMVGTPAKLQAG
jgi:hypothetical protein